MINYRCRGVAYFAVAFHRFSAESFSTVDHDQLEALALGTPVFLCDLPCDLTPSFSTNSAHLQPHQMTAPVSELT